MQPSHDVFFVLSHKSQRRHTCHHTSHHSLDLPIATMAPSNTNCTKSLKTDKEKSLSSAKEAPGSGESLAPKKEETQVSGKRKRQQSTMTLYRRMHFQLQLGGTVLTLWSRVFSGCGKLARCNLFRSVLSGLSSTEGGADFQCWLGHLQRHAKWKLPTGKESWPVLFCLSFKVFPA